MMMKWIKKLFCKHNHNMVVFTIAGNNKNGLKVDICTIKECTFCGNITLEKSK